MASQDRWAGWPEEGGDSSTGSESQKTKSDAPKRKGYQESRRQDRDRRDNWRKKDGTNSDNNLEGDSGDVSVEVEITEVKEKLSDKYAQGDLSEQKETDVKIDNMPGKAFGDNATKLSKSNECQPVIQNPPCIEKNIAIKNKAMPASTSKSSSLKGEDEKDLKVDKEKNQVVEKENLEEQKNETCLKDDNEKQLLSEELQFLKDFISEVEDRLAFHASLREKNLDAVENRPDLSHYGKLDSNLKKNTAFVKKLRNLTEGQKESLARDFLALNLSKYIGEAAAAITESKLKMSDVNCAVLVCSLLHQRYAEFSQSLLENWHKVLLTKKKKVPTATLR